MAKGDRKHEYDLALVERLATEGLTIPQMARILEIPLSTFELYKAQDQALDAAVKKGKATPNMLVEQALLRNAMGFKAIETKERRIKEIDQQGQVQYKMVTVEKITKFNPGNSSDRSLWLNANWPQKYRQQMNLVHSFASVSRKGNSGE